MFDAFEEAINGVTDKDWNWWPFLWLRPEKHVHLSLRRLASLATLYGAPSGALAGAVGALVYPHAGATVLQVAVALPILFLFFATVIVGPMWNRRAARLTRRR